MSKTDWDNLTPTQLMSIHVQSNVEINERFKEVTGELKSVVLRIDGTNDLLKETVINQGHIEKQVESVSDDLKSHKDETNKAFVVIRKEIGVVDGKVKVKNTYIRLIQWIAIAAISISTTFYFSAYRPGKQKTTELSELKVLIEESLKKEP